jgi:Ca2+-binding RTX toxin-like protein
LAGTVTVTEAGHTDAVLHVGANSTHWSTPVSDGNGGILIHDPPADAGATASSDSVWEASAGLLTIDQSISNGGHAVIDGGSIEFVAASDAIVQFSGQVAGTLVLDDVSHFTGTVTGFANGDTIDLAGINPANVGISNSGSLELHYGPAANDFFALVGNYDPASFVIGSDGKGGTDVVWNHQAPVIETDHLAIAQNPDGSTTISGLEVADSDPASSTGIFTVAATTDASGSSVMTSPTGSGSLADVDTALDNGVTYNPGTTLPSTDKVTLTVADSFGATDTVNFIFSEQAADANIALQGPAGKDVIFATGHQDQITGGAGADQFVFAPTSETAAVQHTITDFAAGLDKIDIRQFGNIGSFADLTEAQQGSDTLITLDDHNSVLLKNVIATNLHASDFIISAHGA